MKCIQSCERNIHNNRKYKRLLGFDSSEDTPNITDHEISEKYIICKICIEYVWKYMSK